MSGGHSEDKTGRDFKTFMQSESTVHKIVSFSIVED